jgi:hypothetical protein
MTLVSHAERRFAPRNGSLQHSIISSHISVLQIVDEYPCRTNIEPTPRHFRLPYHYISMQGPTDEASVPMKSYVIDTRILGVTVRRKNGIRTMPVPAEEENPAVPPLPRPPLPPPPPSEDAGPPAAKTPRLQAPTSFSNATDGVTTDPSDDTPTDPVSLAAPLPSAAASRAPRRPWKGEEDGKLAEAVKKHGNDWVAVAAMVPGRTRGQCLKRWTQSLDPSNGKKAGKWKPEEDGKLAEAVKKHGNDWVAVAALVPGRTSDQCHQRWTKSLDPLNRKKGKWAPEEDATLIKAVEKHGIYWAAVATLVPGRTDKQCLKRWTQSLDPSNVKKGKWKPEEDGKLAEAVKKHGNDWVAVAALLSGRTNRQCLQRWTKSLDPLNGNKGKWAPEEDAMLIKAVKKHGNDWVEVAALVSGRTNHQCRRRWVNYLDPDRASNTAEEEDNDGNDEALVDGYIGNDEALV